jgi:starch-binding outer membrane protein, SusD/RagB family
MKTQIKVAATAALALGAVGATACGDDFLTEKPVDFVSPVNFYRNAGDALAAVNAAYATFVTVPDAGNDSYVGRNFVMLTEYPTEVTTSRLSASNERSMIGNFHTQFTSTHPYLEGVWQAAYSGINRANAVIERVPAVPMDEARRAQIVGEAKFVRALHYYWLAGLFGGVPLKLTETQGIGDAPLARATAAETYNQIAKDLTEAAAALPATWGGTDFGRATKGAALTLLGKAYLQSASAFGQTANYQKALDAFNQVRALGYSLDANYGSLFTGANERSPEIIWSIQNVRVNGYGGRLTQWFVPNPSVAIFSSQQNQFQAERPFYDSYNAADIRKDGTWLTSYAKPNGSTVTWTWTNNAITTAANYGSTGPSPRKYVDLGAPSGGAEAPDYVVLRYADVLLSAAETINEISGPTAEAYGYVNQVRARAKVPNLTAGLSKQAFKDSLYVERRFELALEFQGVLDMRRDWQFAKSRVEANLASAATANRSPFTSSVEKPAVATATRIDDKWQLYPIPARACELNDQLTQNPGWTDGICK